MPGQPPFPEEDHVTPITLILFVIISLFIAMTVLSIYADRDAKQVDAPILEVQGRVTSIGHTYMDWASKDSKTKDAYGVPDAGLLVSFGLNSSTAIRSSANMTRNAATANQRRNTTSSGEKCDQQKAYLSCGNTVGFAVGPGSERPQAKECRISEANECTIVTNWNLPRIETTIQAEAVVDGVTHRTNRVFRRHVYPVPEEGILARAGEYPSEGENIILRYRKGHLRDTLVVNGDDVPSTITHNKHFKGSAIAMGVLFFLALLMGGPIIYSKIHRLRENTKWRRQNTP